ncbi:MAG: hypothetical protein NVS1B6_20460 [Steroidobacteraceae bacterium]
MAGLASAVAVGWPHHVTQRGNQRPTVLPWDDARRRHLSLLTKNAALSFVRAEERTVGRLYGTWSATPYAPAWLRPRGLALVKCV